MSIIKMKEQAKQKAAALADDVFELGKRTANEAAKQAENISEKAHQAKEEIQKKYYRPIFLEDYNDPDFSPRMIVVENGRERKSIDVCRGAIGWISKESNLEVLHLHDDFVDQSGLKFHPRALCGSIYLPDTFDKKRFVDLSCYFEVMQQDKMTELRNIAYALGAKQCQLETYEEAKSISVVKGKGRGKGKKSRIEHAEVEASFEMEKQNANARHIAFSQTFEGNAEPHRPDLHWYAHDKEILSLIAMRCSPERLNTTTKYNIRINCATSATMSESFATTVDAAVKKLGASGNFTAKSEFENEMRRRFEFHIVF